MARIIAFVAYLLVVCAVLFAADSSWSKVKDLKNRSELRIYKKGAREPLNATFYEANDERLTVVVKNEQIAIDRQEIDRIDARAATTKRKVNVESTAKDTDPDLKPHPYAGAAVPSTSYSSNVSTVSKPDFETIYRRPAGPAKN